MKDTALIIDNSSAIRAALAQRINTVAEINTIQIKDSSELKRVFSKHKNSIFAAVTGTNIGDNKYGVIKYLSNNCIPTIVLTATNNLETRQEVIETGALDYFCKLNMYGLNQASLAIIRLYKNQSKNIVVLDDSKSMRDSLVAILEENNYKVSSFSNASSTYDHIINNSDTDLLITDHNLPDKNGLELVADIKNNNPEIKTKIIGHSGSRNEELASLFLKAGADDYLRKPFSNDELICRINKNIDLADYIKQINNAANRDPLTNLLNRRSFYNNLTKLEINEKVMCAYIDIDHFKQVNDIHGHNAGDKAIQFVANILSSYFGQDSLLARFGGEEFVVIINEHSVNEFQNNLESLRQKIEGTSIDYDDYQFNITISIGYSNVTAKDKNFDCVIQRADEALYISKTTGRNKVTEYKLEKAA